MRGVSLVILVGAGNLLQADVDALVDTVNRVGVMGKGIALQFKRVYPVMFKVYESAAKEHAIRLGKVFVWVTGQITGPRCIINFPTKRHWRAKSRLEDIEAGLVDLVQVVVNTALGRLLCRPLAVATVGSIGPTLSCVLWMPSQQCRM
jgi:O-acetyl-ADP-ribose deacetylase (regulator of RNase III)